MRSRHQNRQFGTTFVLAEAKPADRSAGARSSGALLAAPPRTRDLAEADFCLSPPSPPPPHSQDHAPSEGNHSQCRGRSKLPRRVASTAAAPVDMFQRVAQVRGSKSASRWRSWRRSWWWRAPLNGNKESSL